MSEERQARQKQRAEAGVLANFHKQWKRLMTLLIGTSICDLLLDQVKSKIMEAGLSSLSGPVKWILGNPFSLLTIAVLLVLLWICWVVITGAIPQESVIVGARQEKLVRSSVKPIFAVGLVLTVLLSGGAVVYGAYRYYTVPLIAIGVKGTWFEVSYKNSDVYINVNLMNYSDVPVIICDPHRKALRCAGIIPGNLEIEQILRVDREGQTRKRAWIRACADCLWCWAFVVSPFRSP
jgi:hypothetical protein